MFNFCVVKQSIIFTGASVTFLLMYLVLWNSHTDHLHISSHDNDPHANNVGYEPISTEQNLILERTTYCNTEEVKYKIYTKPRPLYFFLCHAQFYSLTTQL